MAWGGQGCGGMAASGGSRFRYTLLKSVISSVILFPFRFVPHSCRRSYIGLIFCISHQEHAAGEKEDSLGRVQYGGGEDVSSEAASLLL